MERPASVDRTLTVVVALVCALLAACASPRVPPRVLARVGVLPVEPPAAITIYEDPGFGEGFERLYLDPQALGTSNSPGDIVLMAIWLLSIPAGVLSGLGEVLSGPSPEELERLASLIRPAVPELELGDVVHQEIVTGLQALAGDGPASSGQMHFVDQVESLATLSEAPGRGLESLLEVEIEQVIVSGPRKLHSSGAVVLEARARLLDPEKGRVLARCSVSIGFGRRPFDWDQLERGDVEGFAVVLAEHFEEAAERLAAEIVRSFWARS